MSAGRAVVIAHPSADLYGSDRVMLESVAALVEIGRPVVVALPQDGPLVPEILRRGAQVEFCPSPVLRKSALRPLGLVRLLGEMIRSLPRQLRLLRRLDAEVVYVNTITIPLWLVAAKLGRRRVLCHVHEAEASVAKPLRRGMSLPLLLADQLIANSRVTRGVLAADFKALADRIQVVYSAVPAPTVSEPARENISGAWVLTYVGRLSPRKGPQIAIEALQILTERGFDAHLNLVGSVFEGYEWFERELRELVEQKRLTERVAFSGFQADVWGALAQADIVVVPSTGDEGFGNTAVEAIMASRPLVVSAIGGLVEATGGFRSATSVAPGKPGEIADAVSVVIRHWDEYRQLASVDAEIARERHAPTRYREQIAAIVVRSQAAGAPALQTAVPTSQTSAPASQTNAVASAADVTGSGLNDRSGGTDE